MTMPMTGARGGERLYNDDSHLALRRTVGALRSPVENRPVRGSDQIDGGFATEKAPVRAGTKPVDGFCVGPLPDLGQCDSGPAGSRRR